ncbi:MAG: VOC family protein [Inquilinus sp.]|nr:VOC family protein [Inquilinus sp.]
MSDAFQTQGAFSWCELRAADAEAAKKFYTEVLGWETEAMEMPDGVYTVLKAGGQPVGGIMANPAPGALPHWMSYVTVDDVDKRIEKAQAAGGELLMPAMDVPGVGRMATIADPGGAAISIITYERRDG